MKRIPTWRMLPLRGYTFLIIIITALPGMAAAQELIEPHNDLQDLCDLGARLMGESDFDGALECAEKCLSLANETDTLTWLFEGHLLAGTVYGKRGIYDKALKHGAEALRLSNQFEDQENFSRALNLQSILYRSMGDYHRAMNDSFKALKIEEAAGRKRGMARSYNNLGIVCYEIKDYQRSLEFYEEALALYRELNNRTQEAVALNNIGLIHYDLKAYKESLPYLEQALAIKKDLGDPYSISSTLSNLGSLYLAMDLPEKALAFFQRAMEIHLDLKNRRGQARVALDIGMVRIAQNKNEEALKILEDALDRFKQFGMKKQISLCLKKLSSVHENLGHKDLALDLFKQHDALDHELDSEDHSTTLAELEFRHKAENDQLKIDLLREKNKEQARTARQDRFLSYSFLACAVIFLILLLWVFALYRANRNKNHDLRRQRDALEEAAKRIKTLSGLLPICSHCKKIRDEEGDWQQVETYIHRKSEAKFSHSICPDCFTEHYDKLSHDVVIE